MGLFSFLKDKEPAAPAKITFPAVLGAVADGAVVPMAEIQDEVFSSGVLGPCVGIDPADGRVYAPVDGKISQLTDTRHAVGIEAGGMEILIHAGIDTVDMNGEGFTNEVKEGQTVKKGQLLLTMDLAKVRAAGHGTTVITVLTNADDFSGAETIASGKVAAGADLLRVSK